MRTTMQYEFHRIFVTLLVILMSINVNASFAACNKNMNRHVQHIIDVEYKKLHIPGIQVSIICPGETIPRDFVSGTTTIDGDQQIQNKHLFQVGSETKSFVAVMMLRLEAEGLLSMDDRIGKWLPNIPQWWQLVTIKQLLNHTSGIYNYTDIMLAMLKNDSHVDLNKQWTSQELINLVVEKPNYFEPGHGWHYSNTNYILASMIFEVVTGKPIAQEIETALIKPAGLMNTYYIRGPYHDKIRQKMAHGYSKSGIFNDEPKDITDVNITASGSSGAITSTAHDIAIWFQKLTSGNVLPDNEMKKLTSLVSQKNGEPISDTLDAEGYGLAIMHDFHTFDEESWWHSGGTLGYSSFMIKLKSHDLILAVNVSDMTADKAVDRDIYVLTKKLVNYLQKMNDHVISE